MQTSKVVDYLYIPYVIRLLDVRILHLRRGRLPCLHKITFMSHVAKWLCSAPEFLRTGCKCNIFKKKYV